MFLLRREKKKILFGEVVEFIQWERDNPLMSGTAARDEVNLGIFQEVAICSEVKFYTDEDTLNFCRRISSWDSLTFKLEAVKSVRKFVRYYYARGYTKYNPNNVKAHVQLLTMRTVEKVS